MLKKVPGVIDKPLLNYLYKIQNLAIFFKHKKFPGNNRIAVIIRYYQEVHKFPFVYMLFYFCFILVLFLFYSVVFRFYSVVFRFYSVLFRFYSIEFRFYSVLFRFYSIEFRFYYFVSIIYPFILALFTTISAQHKFCSVYLEAATASTLDAF